MKKTGLIFAILLFNINILNANKNKESKFVTWQDLESGKVPKHGYGRTIFKGDKSEVFDVYYEGVKDHPIIKNEKMILVRMGEPLKGSQVLSGMSGSPVYFKHNGKWKLIGAIAFGYSMPTAGKALGGITPIKAMLNQKDFDYKKLVNKELQKAQLKYSQSLVSLEKSDDKSRKKKLIEKLQKDIFNNLFKPINLGDPNIKLLQPTLTIVKKTKTNSISKKNEKLSLPKPGEAVTMFFVEGDVSLGGTCTVTYVDPKAKKFLACGHPVIWESDIVVPAYKTKIITSYKGPVQAFKMVGEKIGPVGYISYDGPFAIEGIVKKIPQRSMIPVEINISLYGKKAPGIKYSLFRHKTYTASLLQKAAFTASSGLWNEKLKVVAKSKSTVYYDDSFIEIQRASIGGIINNIGPFTYVSSPWTSISETAGLVGHIMASNHDFNVKKIKLSIDLKLGNKVLYIDSYKILNKKNKEIKKVEPGDEARLILGLRDGTGENQYFREISLKIPKDLNIDEKKDIDSEYPINVFIDSGNSFFEREKIIGQQYKPDDKEAFIKNILKDEKDPQKIYIQIVFPKTKVKDKEGLKLLKKANKDWKKVENLNFLREVKSGKIIIESIDSPLENHILNISTSFTINLLIKAKK